MSVTAYSSNVTHWTPDGATFSANGVSDASMQALVDGNQQKGASGAPPITYPSEVRLVYWVPSLAGWFTWLDNGDYIEFRLPTPNAIQTVLLFLQHPLTGCVFTITGKTADGSLVTLHNGFEWLDSTTVCSSGAPCYSGTAGTTMVWISFSNTAEFPAYQIKKVSGSCDSPIWHEVEFPGAGTPLALC